MSEQQQVPNSAGIGFCGALAILFIGLRLGGVIDWPWLWVLSPLWIPVTALFAIIVAVFAVAFVIDVGILLVQRFKKGA